MKFCSKCEEYRYPSDFPTRKDTKDGLSFWCRGCMKTYMKKYNENKKRNQSSLTPQQLEKIEIIQTQRKTCARCKRPKPLDEFHNCKQLGLRKFSYCRQCKSDLDKLDRQTNKDKYRNNDARRRAQMRNVKTESVDRNLIYTRDDRICQICLQTIDSSLQWPDPQSFSIDHIIPISKGGTHTYANVQSAHLLCNIKKGNN